LTTTLLVGIGCGKRRHNQQMNLQKEKTRASQHYIGWREGKHLCFFQSQREFFSLTLPFIERRYRKLEVLELDLSGNPNSPETS
jgi:hypothetical protein